MPHDVIMPALGMAQDTGQILAWHKKPGEAVEEGDVLFEVETDKAAMEVEAQSGGYLTDVTVEAGAEVPVGQIIASISETPEGEGGASASQEPESPPEPAPEQEAIAGDKVIMPALGMAQDTGLIISWAKRPGDQVSADDVLLEVETDKSAMEVPAGYDGYVAEIFAEAGENVPVGNVIAIISARKPEAPVKRSTKSGQPEEDANPKPAEAVDATLAATPSTSAPGLARAIASSSDKLLASPKAKRLAREQGLDLDRLIKAGYPQPYHVADLEILKALPAETAPVAAVATAISRRVTAEVESSELNGFLSWLSDELGHPVRRETVLAVFAAAALRTVNAGEIVIGTEARGVSRTYLDPDLSGFGQVEPVDADRAPGLIVRDLAASPVTSIQLGGEAVPVLSVCGRGETFSLTCECAGDTLSGEATLALANGFAERVADPLRQLL
ncbi:biotin/lipoyl-containing protein [Roseibium sp. MMSF_3544]|uniref:biotin/lipoyl-containing protein n=1 Tax=unclassified Roseibium TaxID=2629323 RepID=UPI00273E3D48|nr:biotin/lipoyl-containing protein [Roseibium sp. MMSF_3544]